MNREKLSSAERKELRTRRLFRCEWCNRWSLATKAEWFYVARDNYDRWLSATEMLRNRNNVMFFCRRRRCQQYRPTRFWLDGLYDPAAYQYIQVDE